MPQTIEQAAGALVPELRECVNFFADDDRRNFIDPTMLLHIAESLMGAFATGMVAEMGKTAGHELATGVIDAIKQRLHGHPPSPAETQAVQAARNALATAPPAAVPAAADAVQDRIRKQLSEVLPDDAAAILATKIRQQALVAVGHA